MANNINNSNNVQSNNTNTANTTVHSPNNMSTMQSNSECQNLVYLILDKALGKFFSPQTVMMFAIWATPYVENYANTLIVNANRAVFCWQLALFTNPKDLYNKSLNSNIIVPLNGAFVVNLTFNAVKTLDAQKYRATLSSDIGNTVILINILAGALCVKIPYIKESIYCEINNSTCKENITLLVQPSFCTLVDTDRNLVYTIYYNATQVTQCIYTDHTNGWKVVCSNDLQEGPNIQNISNH